jgi:SpoVK/Ycf46/Vps4 family AAA+-type ATPase
MDERFFFDIPSEEDRIDIIKIHLAAKKQNPENYQLVELADAASGLVGREIQQAVGQAMTKSFNAKKKMLDQGIFSEELRKKPRIIKTMVDDIREIVEWVGYDPEADDGIRARLASNKRSETFLTIGGGAGG